tara:strand:+ start:1238 stop:1924 length:687 start_codon:yes stop_codon:yes gene_type:complete
MKLTTLFFVICIIHIPPLKAQSFIGSFDLVASQINKNGNARNDTLSYFFGADKTALIIHSKRNQPDMRLVFNPQNSTITGLFEMKGKKGGYILPMNEKHWPGMGYALRAYGTGPRKKLNYTGNTKVIEGLVCEEVLAESDEYNANLWVTGEIPLNMSSVLSYQSVGAGKSQKEREQFDQFGVEPLPLKMNLKSKTGKSNVQIKLINLRNFVNDSIFSSEGYMLSEVEN